MKLTKQNTTMGGYATSDGKFKVSKFNQLHCVPTWMVKNESESKHFKTLKEAKEYISDQYE